MRKRLKVGLGLGLAGALLASVLGAANASAAPVVMTTDLSAPYKVLKFDLKPGGGEFFDLGTAGPSIGDQTIFSNFLYKNGERVGYDAIVCNVVRMNPERTILCDISVSLPDGVLYMSLLRVEPLPPPPTPFYSAIVGGSGGYVGASGQAYIDPSSNVAHTLTIYLER
ncbi:MAG TPA: hypothetical protein VFZ32_03880 [Micromonosporaceae bacterium]